MTQNGRRRRRKLAGTAASPGVPLSRALSKLGILSRAQAVEAIRAGRVSVDGVRRSKSRPCSSYQSGPGIASTVSSAGAQPWRTILFHKPRGVVTTRRDPEGRRTVYDVLGEDGEGLVAVGRLDLATSGLLLLTSDTRLADWITDPVHQVPRVYAVTVRGRIAVAQLALLPGVTLRKASARESHLTVELREGRNRQVRRMFDAIGHEVTRLKRVKLGSLDLEDLAPGQFRDVLRAEIRVAFPGAPVCEV